MAQEGTVVTINAALATDIGLKRKLNEDSGIARFPVFAIADGMGGHDSGEVASAIVVEELGKLSNPDNPQPTRTRAVIDALKTAHRRVSELSATRPHGAGSTVSGVALVMRRGVPHWLVFNVGDSRVYRSLGNSLAQWTRDHSVVQLWVDQGIITPAEALTSTRSHEITKAVGAPDSKPDFFFAPVVNGERLLLCSDGLYTMLNSEAIRASLIMSGTPKTTTEGLVERAIVAGGADNITAIVIDVVSGGLPPESDADSSIIDQSIDALAKAQAEAEETATVRIPRPNAVANFEEVGLDDEDAALPAGTGIVPDDEAFADDSDTDDTDPSVRDRIQSEEVAASIPLVDTDMGDSEDIRVAPAHEVRAHIDVEDDPTVIVIDDADQTALADPDAEAATVIVDREAEGETVIVDRAAEDETVIVDRAAEDETVIVDREAAAPGAIEADEDEPSEDDGLPIELVTPMDLDPAPNAPRDFIYSIDDADTNTGF